MRHALTLRPLLPPNDKQEREALPHICLGHHRYLAAIKFFKNAVACKLGGQWICAQTDGPSVSWVAGKEIYYRYAAGEEEYSATEKQHYSENVVRLRTDLGPCAGCGCYPLHRRPSPPSPIPRFLMEKRMRMHAEQRGRGRRDRTTTYRFHWRQPALDKPRNRVIWEAQGPHAGFWLPKGPGGRERAMGGAGRHSVHWQVHTSPQS